MEMGFRGLAFAITNMFTNGCSVCEERQTCKGGGGWGMSLVWFSKVQFMMIIEVDK